MATLQEVREKFPQWSALSDDQFADRLYQEHYADKLPRADFNARIGYAPGVRDRGWLNDFTDQVVQGISGGLTDEMSGAAAVLGNVIRSPFTGEDIDPNAAWELGVNRQRQQMDNFAAENPVSSVAANIGGSLLPATATYGVAQQALRRFPQAAQAINRLPQWLQFGAAGGAGAAVTGFNEGEGGLLNRVENAATMAPFGVAGGITIPAIVNTIVRTGKAAIPWILTQLGATTTGPRDLMLRQLLQRTAQDEMTVDDLVANLQRLGPEAGIVDAGGENVLSYGRALAQRPGVTQNRATEFFDERQAGAGERAWQAVTENLTGGDPRFYDRIDELSSQRSLQARPLYDEAYQQPALLLETRVSIKNVDGETVSMELGDLFERPSMREALARAFSIAKEEGRNPNQLGFVFNDAGDPVGIQQPSWQTLDYVRRGLDDVLERWRNPQTGKLENLGEYGRALLATRTGFNNVLRNENPLYAQALDAWSGPSHAIDVMWRGRGFIKGDSDALARRLEGLSDQDLDLFRIGAAQELRQIIARSPDNADIFKRIYGNQQMRERLASIFPDRQALGRFIDAMMAEKKFANSRNIAAPRSGSQTTPRELDNAEMGVDPNALIALLDSVQTQSPRGIIRSTMELLRNGLPPSQRVADQGAALFSNDQAANQAFLDMLRREQTRQMLNMGPAGNVMGYRGLLTGTMSGGLLGSQ